MVEGEKSSNQTKNLCLSKRELIFKINFIYLQKLKIIIMVLEKNKIYTDEDVFVKMTNIDKSDSTGLYGEGFRLSTNSYVINNYFELRGGVRELTLGEMEHFLLCYKKKDFIEKPKTINYEIY